MIHMEIEKLFQKFQLHIPKWFNLEFILDSPLHIFNRKIQAEYLFQERLHSPNRGQTLLCRLHHATCMCFEPIKVNRQATVDGSYITSVANVDVAHAPDDLKLTIEDTNVILEVLGERHHADKT